MSYRIIARYGGMGFLGSFNANIPGLRRGDKVVLRTDRGIEAGDVVTVLDDSAAGNVGPGEVGPGNVRPVEVGLREVGSSGVGSGEVRPVEVRSGDVGSDEVHPVEVRPVEVGSDEVRSGDGQVIRRLSPDDEKELRRINDEAIPREMTHCREHIKLLSLPMKLVDAEHLLGGEKIIFYFVADGRVDFRQLVKDIAREYKTRIELRQIGVRDEARLLSELGHCGQCLCCKTFMKSLEPVTMRMAKSQKATLDPTKISGVCGRLMCCLRYEDKVYSELKTKLPKRGAMVTTRRASGKVVDTDVLAQVVSIRTSDSNLIRVPASDIVSVEGHPSQSSDDDDSSVQSAPPAPAAQPVPQAAAPPRPDRRGPSDNRGPAGERRPGGEIPQSGQPAEPRQPGQTGDARYSGQGGRGPNDRRGGRHRRRRGDGQPPKPKPG